MPADASIYNLLRPQQRQPGPMDQYAQGLQVRQLLDQGDLAGMQRQKLQRDFAEEDAWKQAISGANLQDDATIGRLMGVSPSRAMALQKGVLDTRKTRADIGKTEAEAAAKVIDTYRNMLGGVGDQQSYSAWRQGLITSAPGLAGAVPEQFTPDTKMALLMKADQLVERLSPKLERQDAGGRVLQVNPYTGAEAGPAIEKTMTPDARANAVTVPDATGAYQPNRPVIQAKAQIAAAGRPNVTTNILPPQKTFENEDKLRGDYTANPMVKSSAEMNNAFRLIEAAYNRPSAANDLAMATKYMKILDPTSVVRESEFALAVNATGLLDKVQNYAASVIEGKKLNPAQRKDFYESAKAINDAFQAERQKVDDQYSEMATGYGLNPKNVIPSLRSKKPDAGKPTPQARKTIGGKNYVQVDGNWFEE